MGTPPAERLELEYQMAEETGPSLITLRYRGTPPPTERSVVLASGEGGWRLSRLRATVADPRGLDPAIELWVCLDDSNSPLVRVGLAELLALGGERPLNLAVPSGARVQLVLWLGEATWPSAAAELQVEVN